MLKFKTYKNNNELFDFSSGSIPQVLLESFTTALSNGVPAQSEIEFSLEDSAGVITEYKIVNNNGQQILVNNNAIAEKSFFELLKNKTGLNIDAEILKSRLVIADSTEDAKAKIASLKIEVDSVLLNKKKELEAELAEQKTQIEGGLNDDQKDKYTRLQELNLRLESVQEQIDFYQNEKKVKEDLNTKIKKLSTEQETINQMLRSVELLIKNREELAQKISAYSGISQTPEQIKNLKLQKINYLNGKLFANKTPTTNILEDQEDSKEGKSKINFNVIILLTIVNIFVTIIGFLYSYNLNVLVIGVIFTIVLMVLYVVSRFFSDSLEGINPVRNDTSVEQLPLPKVVQPEPEDPNAQLFINSAWASALQNELTIIDANIQKNLNGKTYDILKHDQSQTDEALKKENATLESLNAKSITSDEYYKKRREADILKIERENLEFGLKLDPSSKTKVESIQKSIKEIETTIEYGSKVAQIFPIFVSGGINSEQIMQIKQNLLNQLVLVIAN